MLVKMKGLVYWAGETFRNIIGSILYLLDVKHWLFLYHETALIDCFVGNRKLQIIKSVETFQSKTILQKLSCDRLRLEPCPIAVYCPLL